MKSVFEKLGLLPVAAPVDDDARGVLHDIVEEIVAARRASNAPWDGVNSLKESPTWVGLKDAPAALQINVALAALGANKRGHGGSGGWDYWLRRDLPFAVARMILQRKLEFTDDQIVRLLNGATGANHLTYQFPVATVLGAAERHLGGKTPDGQLRTALQAFARRVRRERNPTQAIQKLKLRAEAMLEPETQGLDSLAARGGFSKKLANWAGDDPSRVALATFLGDVSSGAKPSKKWLSEGTDLVAAAGAGNVWKALSQWMDEEVPDPAEPDLSLEMLKALIWLSPPDLAPQISRFCQTCFRKVPNIGARSIKLGNACLYALEKMGGDKTAVAELARLSREIRYGSVRDQIANRLARVAESEGVSVDALEDRSLPDFGLDANGVSETKVGDYIARLTLGTVDARLEWQNANGKVLKSVPKPVRDQHGDTLKDLRSRLKDIEGARKSTVARLENGWIDGLEWNLSEWRDLFDGHPLRRQITRALIWQVNDGESVLVARPGEDGWFGPNGQPVEAPDQGQISLWHPLDSNPDEVLAWRRHILDAGITQPIKQAHREVYVLTDAERQTEVYSNRFAAHILRQHQFKALCEARGWRYMLMGPHFDGHNTPQRALSSLGLSAEYTVDLVDDGATSETGIASHLASDQVGFLDASFNRIPLIDIPPIVFSEVMRDVDLFVAVTSVANDSAWTDGGPEGRFGRYWQAHAFGDLTANAETRKQLMEDLLPKLAIAEKCRIDGKFLIVTGQLNEYAIHLGSSNIQIRPSNRYLCIVPGRGPKDMVRLPFAGDGTLSIILSKAYYLIDDHKITDRTVLTQLQRQ